MAIDVEREARLYAVDDDPMRAVGRNGARSLPAIADPTAAAALYAAFAGVINTTYERTLLQLVPMRRAHR